MYIEHNRFIVIILIIRRHVSACGGHHQVKIRVSWGGRWVWVANGIPLATQTHLPPQDTRILT